VRSNVRRAYLFFALVVGAADCSLLTNLDDIGDAGGDASAIGTEGHACYANGTCNGGLTCASNLCVRIDGGPDGAGADASVDDASLEACPSVGPFTSDAGPFCPFQNDGGPFAGDCPNNDHCCEYTVDSGLASTCNVVTLSCANVSGTLDFRCNETNDCPTANKCCLNGSVLANTDAGCIAYIGASDMTGTTCAATCATQVCGTNADCPSSQTCVPFKIRAVVLGFCQ